MYIIKKISKISTLCLIIWLLVSCGSAEITPTTVPQSTVVVPTTRTVIRLWHGENGTISDVLRRVLLDYQRDPAHGNISIVIESHGVNLLKDYQQAVLSGDAPELILLSENRWIGDLADRKLIVDLTDKFASNELGRFYPAALDGARYEQRLYGLPLSLDLPVLFYNQAPLITTTLTTTNDLFIASGKQIEFGLPPSFTYNLSLYFTQPYLSAFDGEFFDAAGTNLIASSSYTPTLEWLTWIHGLSQDPRILARDDHRLINRSIQQNTALMTIDWASNLASYRQIWFDNVAVRPLPILSETGREPRPWVRSSVMVLNPRSSEQQQNAALAIMRFLVSDDIQMALQKKDVPSVVNTLTEQSPQQAQISQAVTKGIAWSTNLRINKNIDILSTMVRNVLSGTPIETSMQNTIERLHNP